LSYNLKIDRTKRINGTVSIDGKIAVFVQGMEITIDAGVLQRDSIGTGESVFTQNGDVIGSFSFSLRNTTSLFDPSTTPTLKETISYWMNAISTFNPSKIDFIQTFNAPEGTGSKFARIKFTGRIMTPTTVMSVDDGLEDINVGGEITIFTSAKREATASISEKKEKKM
jgi:hypothetical protein